MIECIVNGSVKLEKGTTLKEFMSLQDMPVFDGPSKLLTSG